MVFKKGLDYGFNAFTVSNIPRAPRSIRRRDRRTKRSVEDTRICAFELLASLAGKLLEESEGSASSNAYEGHNHVPIGKDVVKLEMEYDDDKCVEHVSCEGSAVASDYTTENNDILNEYKHTKKDDVSLCVSTKMRPACSEQVKGDPKSAICKRIVVYESFPDNNLDGHSPKSRELCDGIIKNGVKRERETIGTMDIANTCPEKDPLELSTTLSASIDSDRDVKLPSRSDSVPDASFSRHRNYIKLGSRDDDDKFSRFNKLNNKFKASRPTTRFEDRRIRKMITSKYWKATPKLKDFERSRADGGMIKPTNHKRKTYYSYEKCQYDTLIKRRKFFDRSSIVTHEKVMKENKSSSTTMSNEACEISSLLTCPQASHTYNYSHVRFSIKSFRIPELYIEVPETATVGSLKRTVMEAVTALLGDRIRVGVLLQGKKVRDDSRTLLQTGISCEDNLDALGFILEPGLAIAPRTSPIRSEEPHLLLPSCTAPRNLTSSLATRAIEDATPDSPLLTNSAKHVDSNYKHVSFHSEMLIEQNRARVPVSAMNVEALAVVPVNQKNRKSELAQRRTRRPFSVTEVEALVHAVEELGTGRWRDVKLRAFENADHRTYVDLKDKWKTLVHTAKISPQQRRGEPVPQELLDRVIAAHAYWSQHQAKQQGKHHAGTLSITDSRTDRNGVAVAIPSPTASM